MKDLASLHLDNHDSRLKYYHLFMTMPAETEIPHYDLPAGYSFTTYTRGDRDTWIEIEKSAKEFSTFEEGVDAWQRYYGKHEDVLPDRMFFIVTQTGNVVIIPMIIFVILLSTIFKFFLIASRIKFTYSLVFLNGSSICAINHLFRMFGQELISTSFTT